MSQNRLLLLAMLQVEQQHGYQLMEMIDESLSHLTSLKRATAYYELKRMEQEGLIAARQEQEEGRPPRRVYSVTEAGQGAFLELLRSGLREPALPVSEGDVAMMLLDRLPRAEAEALLAERLAGLKQRQEACRRAPRHPGQPLVDRTMAHTLARLELEMAWVEEMLAAVRTEVGQP